MSSEDPIDLPPSKGADSGNTARISPLGHERLASDEGRAEQWEAIAASSDFKALLAAKARFIVPMTIFFIVYYFALPVLVGFFPALMKTKVGKANAAYLFALSQFFVAWVIAFSYARVAARWDEMARRIVAKFPLRKRS